MATIQAARSGSFLLASPWRTRFSLIAAGACYPLAFSPFDFWPAAFISLAFLLWTLVHASLLRSFYLGFWWGLGCFGVGASWVYISIHEFGFVPAPGAATLTLIFVAFLALFKGLFSYLCRGLLRRCDNRYLVLAAPLLWLLSELLQASIFNGFPWLLTGYSQVDSPLASLAPYLGIYGISWFTLVIASLLVLAISAKTRQIALKLMLVVLAFLLLAFVINTSESEIPSQKNLKVALVQPNIKQSIKWDEDYFNEIIDVLLAETEKLWGADLILWPEGAIPAYAHQVQSLTRYLSEKAEQSGSQLVVGIPEYRPDSARSFVALQSYGSKPQTYHKQVLVPFGEYVPFEQWLRGLIQFLDLPMSDFSPAITPQSAMQFDQVTVIPAVCYEIAFPGIVQKLSHAANQPARPQMIATVSNEAWFGDSLGPHQHLQMARMRALELGVPLIRATNDGITAIVDHRGKILASLPRYQQQSLSFDLALTNRDTFFKRFGFLGVYLLLLLNGVFLLIACRHKTTS